ncbi:MAG: LytTR family transcriptional regulator DNA-binding domain-containing protein [Prevotellaceae bacterium]|nr:LytTR family transcriptional regulator DNA-binding domain-containing protein [Prevotellaceae bacterium]
MNYDLQNRKSVVITTAGITRQFIAASITHIVCDGYLCDVYIEGNEKVTCSKLLKFFETELACCGFVWIHHDTLVNAKYIRQINNRKKEIVLTDNTKLKVSRRKMTALKRYFIDLH